MKNLYFYEKTVEAATGLMLECCEVVFNACLTKENKIVFLIGPVILLTVPYCNTKRKVTPDFGKACRTRVPIDKDQNQYIITRN